MLWHTWLPKTNKNTCTIWKTMKIKISNTNDNSNEIRHFPLSLVSLLHQRRNYRLRLLFFVIYSIVMQLVWCTTRIWIQIKIWKLPTEYEFTLTRQSRWTAKQRLYSLSRVFVRIEYIYVYTSIFTLHFSISRDYEIPSKRMVSNLVISSLFVFVHFFQLLLPPIVM